MHALNMGIVKSGIRNLESVARAARFFVG